MQTAKNILIFFLSAIIMGLFVILLDKMFPTDPINKMSFQPYYKKEIVLEVGK